MALVEILGKVHSLQWVAYPSKSKKEKDVLFVAFVCALWGNRLHVIIWWKSVDLAEWYIVKYASYWQWVMHDLIKKNPITQLLFI